MENVKIGEFEIGDGNTPFFVAELGICHGGDIKTALDLTQAAAEAGAHCVKTETFQRSNIVFDPSAVASYKLAGKKITAPLAEHMDKYELTFDEHHKIKKLCDELSLPFMSTAHDFNSIDFLINIGASAIKIASPDIIHYPLLRYAAKSNLPIFLDTGAAYQYEVEIAVKTLRENGCKNIVVNHNPAGHPAPVENHDLRIIPRLKQILNIPIGLADHYEGYEMAYAAVAMGANTIEKPISLDRFIPEPERNYSISKPDISKVIKMIEKFYFSMGNEERKMNKDQENYRNNNRSACVAGKDMEKGTELGLDNIVFGRPRKGIGVEFWDIIKGRKIRNYKKQNEFIQWEDLD